MVLEVYIVRYVQFHSAWLLFWHFASIYLQMGHFRKDPHPPHGGNGKWHPPPNPFGHPRIAKPLPSPDSKVQNYTPQTLVILRGLINISQQRYSDDRTSWTSVTSTNSQQHLQALVLHFRDTFSQLAVATRQQHSVKGQLNEGQSLKSKQTFRFEAERYYFNWIWGFCSPRVCLCAHHPITTGHMTF